MLEKHAVRSCYEKKGLLYYISTCVNSLSEENILLLYAHANQMIIYANCELQLDRSKESDRVTSAYSKL